MTREQLFKKYYKNKNHDYEIAETLQYEDDTGRKPDILFVYSGRNRGKSFEISSQLIADAWYDNKQFAYVRRNDATVFETEQYFADKKEFIKDMTDELATEINRIKGKLWFVRFDENDDGELNRVLVKECGYFFALSRQASYKSLQYPEVFNIIFEEVLTDGAYLASECEKLMNLYSTIKRDKDNFRMWLISNTISVVNPYSQSWGIYLARNKPGEIKLSKLYLGSYDENKNEKYLLIAAHYLKDKDDLTKEDLKLNRNRIKTGIASNKWDELNLYPTMDLSFVRPYQEIGTAIFEYDDLMFKMDLIIEPENILEVYEEGVDRKNTEILIGYIQRKTSEPKENERIYTNNPKRLSNLTTNGFKILYKMDEVIDGLIKRGHLVGADNLTMNDFYRCLKLLINKKG